MDRRQRHRCSPSLTLWLVARAFASSPARPAGVGVGRRRAPVGRVGERIRAPPPVPTPGRVPATACTLLRADHAAGALVATARSTHCAADAGARPTDAPVLRQVDQEFRPDAVAMCYRQRRAAAAVLGALGRREVRREPAHVRAAARSRRAPTTPYITRFATAIRDQSWPVAIRFAHEMNGNWYPWSESRSGNRPGDYVQAWRHVHDIFTRVGADERDLGVEPQHHPAGAQVEPARAVPGRRLRRLGRHGRLRRAGARPPAEVFDPTIARASHVHPQAPADHRDRRRARPGQGGLDRVAVPLAADSTAT